MLRKNLDKESTTVRTGYSRRSFRQGQAVVTTVQLKPTDTDRRMGAAFRDRSVVCPSCKNTTLWSTMNSNTGRSTIHLSYSGITIQNRPPDLAGQEHDNQVTLRKRGSTWQNTTKRVLVVFELLIISSEAALISVIETRRAIVCL